MIDFLKGYIIGLAILKLERIYLDYILDFLILKGKKFLLNLIKFLKNLIKKEEDEYELVDHENIHESLQEND